MKKTFKKYLWHGLGVKMEDDYWKKNRGRESRVYSLTGGLDNEPSPQGLNGTTNLVGIGCALRHVDCLGPLKDHLKSYF